MCLTYCHRRDLFFDSDTDDVCGVCSFNFQDEKACDVCVHQTSAKSTRRLDRARRSLSGSTELAEVSPKSGLAESVSDAPCCPAQSICDERHAPRTVL